MPYIKEERRDALTQTLGWPAADTPKNAGELNYVITVLFIQYWKEHGPRYQTINDIVGAACSAVHEFERRVVGKYEDGKIEQNGDLPYHDT